MNRWRPAVREWLLNGLLAVQVLASLAMTGMLMTRPVPGATPVAEPAVAQAAPATVAPPPDVLRPRLIWFTADADRYVGIGPVQPGYREMWAEVSMVLTRLLSRSETLQPVWADELKAAAAGPLLGVDLPLELSAGQWSRVLGLRPVELPGEMELDRVVFALGSPGRAYFMGNRIPIRALDLAEGDRRQLLFLVQRASLARLPAYRPLATWEEASRVLNPYARAHGATPASGVEDRLRGSGPLVDPWVMVPAEPIQVPSPVLEPRLPVAGEVVPRAFPDVTVVREVREQDGAHTYTDGRRALRLYPGGQVQFWEVGEPAPATQPAATDLASALHIATGFVSRMGLWPEQATLATYRAGGDSVVLTFRLETYLPVEGPEPFLEVRVSHGRVTYLFRGPDIRMVGPAVSAGITLPDQLLGRLAEVVPPTVRIRGVWPAYRIQGGKGLELVPVWTVQLSTGKRMFFAGPTGQWD